MEPNILLIIFILIMLCCMIRGATKGMLRIVYGLIAWIILIIFVNYAAEFVNGYISINTAIPITVEATIDEHLHQRYITSEEQEAGSGEASVLAVVPQTIKDKITDAVRTSIDATIDFIAKELTAAAIKGISTILCVLVGILLLFLLSKLIKLIGFVPGVRDVNRLFGVIAGLIEGLLLTWLLMYIADCFPTSVYGQFVLENVKQDQILTYVYENNVIARIIGI